MPGVWIKLAMVVARVIIMVFVLGVIIVMILMVVMTIAFRMVVVPFMIMIVFFRAVIIMMIFVIVMLIVRNRLNPRRHNDRFTFEISGLGKPLQPALKLKTVEEQKLCLRNRACRFRCGLVDMRVSVRPNKCN